MMNPPPFNWLPDNFDEIKNRLESRFDSCATLAEVESAFLQMMDGHDLTRDELEFVQIFADRRRAQLKGDAR